MDAVEIKISGISPILMNNPMSIIKAKKGKKRKVEYVPEEEAEIRTYRDESGNLCVPAIALRTSILDGAKSFTAGKKSLRTLLLSALEFNDSLFPLLDGKGKPISTYMIDTRTVVVQRARVIRHRPRINLPWNLEAVLAFDKSECTVGQLMDAIIQAGKAVGLLDYRVTKGGGFGKYEVKSCKEIK